jgi:hypothetical protein
MKKNQQDINKLRVITSIAQSISDKESDNAEDFVLREEIAFYDEQIKYLKRKNNKLYEEIKDLRSFRRLRENYAFYCFLFLGIWCFAVFILIVIQGFQLDIFHLSDVIMTTLLGSTTISVIGLVGFITQGLFSSKKD